MLAQLRFILIHFILRDIIIEEQSVNQKKVIGNGSSNGINTSYFNSLLFSNEEKQALKIKVGIAPDDFVFIFVGRLVGDKGINELIAAFRKISGPAKVKLCWLVRRNGIRST
jgi:glycosyltransferase involved in cell wall biosynthesis